MEQPKKKYADLRGGPSVAELLALFGGSRLETPTFRFPGKDSDVYFVRNIISLKWKTQTVLHLVAYIDSAADREAFQVEMDYDIKSLSGTAYYFDDPPKSYLTG